MNSPSACLADDEAVEVARRAGDVAQELAVRRVDLQPGRGILHADVDLALRAHGDVAVLVADLRPAIGQLQPVPRRCSRRRRRRGNETQDRQDNEASALHGGAIMALT